MSYDQTSIRDIQAIVRARNWSLTTWRITLSTWAASIHDLSKDPQVYEGPLAHAQSWDRNIAIRRAYGKATGAG